MRETTSYERNKDVILNRAKDYHENSKELLRERAKNRVLSEEKKYKERIWKKQIS